ncbi:hypothetical protein ONE63_011450 [Megalurothrips usitatus]|uniref:Uncharacterized protein n=1 Tax=Megalurothrips usitatus TaxID=439358 RepID=A0AAV7X383_9NEOP|nr:hypothetical protein ONE63_011450 [Megalurothrips usitatus]
MRNCSMVLHCCGLRHGRDLGSLGLLDFLGLQSGSRSSAWSCLRLLLPLLGPRLLGLAPSRLDGILESSDESPYQLLNLPFIQVCEVLPSHSFDLVGPVPIRCYCECGHLVPVVLLWWPLNDLDPQRMICWIRLLLFVEALEIRLVFHLVVLLFLWLLVEAVSPHWPYFSASCSRCCCSSSCSSGAAAPASASHFVLSDPHVDLLDSTFSHGVTSLLYHQRVFHVDGGASGYGTKYVGLLLDVEWFSCPAESRELELPYDEDDGVYDGYDRTGVRVWVVDPSAPNVIVVR